MTTKQPSPFAAKGPASGLSALVLRRVLSSRLHFGTLTVTTPSGLRVANPGAAPGPVAELVLNRWRALRRMLFGGDLGLADAYLDGDWDSPDLASLIELAALNTPTIDPQFEGSLLSRFLRRLGHARNGNTRRGARRNIEAHYDLGNEFYERWLDAGMTYSSAMFAQPDMSLEDAQCAKQDRVIAALALGQGARVLEIGCGWGGLAEALVRRAGAHVTGVTLSPAQAQYARDRLTGQPAEIRLQDYRDLDGKYDGIVSIEMLEAVGAAYWPDYFARLNAALKPGARAVLQVISIAEDRFDTYLRRPDFIQRHIFPGGMLPTVEIMRREIGAAGLKLVSLEHFGQSYAATLAEWHRRFEASWSELRDQGFDERFRRKWRYYLQYCEGGFRAGAIDVGLYTLVKES
jgi:cyclopropane-fatty-acyl-phospholipid synthase